MQTTQIIPKIYVACLGAYNNGILHGQWIDANQEAEAIHSEIQEMLALSPIAVAEEWAIHDYEGFKGLQLSEYEDIGKVSEISTFIEKYGEAWALYAEYVGFESATKDNFEDAYQGRWDSEQDFAEELASEILEIPEHLQFYIDYEKFSRDLFINDYFSANAEACGVHVYRS